MSAQPLTVDTELTVTFLFRSADVPVDLASLVENLIENGTIRDSFSEALTDTGVEYDGYRVNPWPRSLAEQ